MKKLIFLSLNILLCLSAFAQQGKDGAGNISTANTIVNNVSTTLTSNAAIGTTTIAVVSSAGLAAGDLLFIMQAQGATVYDSTNYWGNPNQVYPFDTSAGKIHKYNGAGNNEVAEINSIVGNVITLNCALSDSFRGSSFAGDITTQIVRVPRYTTLTLTGAGSITCNAWNGSTGGVIVIEVKGNTTLAAGTSINATAKGFRGGSAMWVTGWATSNSVGFNYQSTNTGGHKGESIVGDTNQYKKQAPYGSTGTNFSNASNWWNSTPLTICKGNVANGGGGGDANNCGGGGGSNGGVISQWNGMGNPDPAYPTAWSKETPATNTNGTLPPTSSSGGGRGGYAFSANSNVTADPTVTGPDNSGVWAGDSRHNDGGWGGVPLNYSNGRIFFGGGAGAGDGNDGHATSGGNGGGIVYLLSYGTVTGAGQIIADGNSASSTNTVGPNSNGDDGAGGGGGGGTVFVKSVGAISLTAATPISAQGGKGGDNNLQGFASTPHCFGPGGGGGGGYVATSNAVVGVNVNGGKNGIVTGNNSSKIKTLFPPNGATIGGAGSITTLVTPFYLTAKNDTVCPSSAASLSVTVNGTAPSGLAVEWYTVATGGASVSSSNPYNITSPATAGTYTYYAGTCPGTYRIPVILVVNPSTPPALTITATNTLVCSGTAVTLTVSGATSYTWGANAGSATTNTVLVTPIGNTTYTVTGANTGACAGTNTASININVIAAPSITITPTSFSLCSGVNDTLKASGATTYTWSSNAASATTNSVIVSPPVGATTYSITGSNGTCTSTQSVSINVTANPTVTISPTNAYICKGSSTSFTASGATTYSWSTTATTNTVSVSPTSNTTYTVTGYNGACFNTKTVLVKIDNGITKADSVSNTASCGQANGSYVLNSVTGGISPYQINFNGTGFSTIPAFTYSVGSLMGNTYPIILKDSLGCTYATSVTIGNTSGITKIDSVIANANCVPANSGTITINSVTGGSAPYQASINNGGFNPISSFPYSFPNLAAGTYTIQVKDGTGCPHISFITVGSNGGPTSVATSTIQPDTCGKHVGTITVGSVTGGANPYQYSIDGSTFQTSNIFTGLVGSTGLVNYTVTIKDNNGCSITSTNNGVGSISGPASASVTSVPDTCSKHVGVITINSVIGGTGPYTYALNSGSYQTATSFNALAASTTDTIKVKDNSGCIFVSPNYTVGLINSATTPTITTANGSTTFCQGGSLTLTSSSASSYSWSTGGTAQTITVSTSGIYLVTTTSSTGCKAKDSIIVSVINPQPPVINDTTVTECQNSIHTIPFNHSTGTLIIHNAAGQIQPLPFKPTTVGTTTYTAYDSLNGCVSAVKNITIKINVAPTTVPTVTTPVVYCYGQVTDTLKALPTVSGGYVVFEDANHTVLTTPPAPSPSSTILDTTTYYVYQGVGACPSALYDSIKVIILNRPSPNFTVSPSTNIYVGQSVSFIPVQTGTTNIYSWNFGDAGSTSNTSSAQLPNHTYNNAGSYCPQLIVTNSLGCKDSTTLCLDILSTISLSIPNVFSPNDDGINDVFSIKTTGITDLSCDIFDRWGLKLYSWNGVTGFWDGSEKGGKAVDGTYYYIVQTTDVKGISQTNKGFLQLIK